MSHNSFDLASEKRKRLHGPNFVNWSQRNACTGAHTQCILFLTFSSAQRIIGPGWQTYLACEALTVNTAVKGESAALVLDSV